MAPIVLQGVSKQFRGRRVLVLDRDVGAGVDGDLIEPHDQAAVGQGTIRAVVESDECVPLDRTINLWYEHATVSRGRSICRRSRL